MKKSFFLFLLIISACSSEIIIKPAKFDWPIESISKVDLNGKAEIQRYSLALNTRPIFFQEFSDSNAVEGKEVRIIRDEKGYYYFYAENFSNVYVLSQVAGGFKLEKKILIPEANVTSLAFNQKSPYIEMVTKNNKFLINNYGLVEKSK